MSATFSPSFGRRVAGRSAVAELAPRPVAAPSPEPNTNVQTPGGVPSASIAELRAICLARLEPTAVASINVQASNGWFDISVTDPSNARPGLFYFAESDTTPAFNSPRVYFMGASRNLYLQLGNQTLR